LASVYEGMIDIRTSRIDQEVPFFLLFTFGDEVCMTFPSTHLAGGPLFEAVRLILETKFRKRGQGTVKFVCKNT
jgi:hypothetical protein